MAWAVADLTYLDGALRREGIDLGEVLHPTAGWELRRFVALLHSMMIDRTSLMEKEDRDELLAILEWPETTEARADDENQRILNEGLAHLGVRIDFEAFARARSQAETTRMQDETPQTDHNDGVLGSGDA